MSITISPAGNSQFCEQHGLTQYEVYDCFCGGSGRRGEGGEECWECKGEGEVKFPYYPNEMNLANGNFSTLWNALGLDFDYCGSICPNKLLAAIESVCRQYGTDTLVRSEVVHNARPNFISCGISDEQATRYLTGLTDLAQAAAGRGVEVTWG